ncbi:MAG: hypothetical protein ACI9MC_002584 [Kiritimatiellia bacterium]|jgi:hypothetical protein
MSKSIVPIYAIVGDRPVKAEQDEDGNTWVWAWDWKRKIFIKSPEYFEQVFFPTSPDIDLVSAEEFEKRVDDLLFA